MISLVVLTFGMAILAAIAPFRANHRASRTRVFSACLAYVLASALAFVLASAASGTFVGALAVLPVAGAALAFWAYKTRNRVRVSRYACYFQE